MSARVLKAESARVVAEQLLQTGCYREGIILFWLSIRDSLFFALETRSLSFAGTEEAIQVGIAEVLSPEQGELLMQAYSLGTMAEWDESLKVDESLGLRMQQVFKQIYPIYTVRK